MTWNLTLLHIVTGDRLKSEQFSSRTEVELRRLELEELLASAHCSASFAVCVTQSGGEASAIGGIAPRSSERLHGKALGISSMDAKP